MAPPNTQHLKVLRVISAIRDAKFRNLNEFLVELYRSENEEVALAARNSLRYYNAHPDTFLPYLLLNLMQARCHDKKNFGLTISRKAAEIGIEELKAAARQPEVHIEQDDQRLTASDSDFGLPGFFDLYSCLLPCTFTYLSTLLSAWNRSEERAAKEKLERAGLVKRVIVAIISMLLFVHSQRANAFPLLFGLFLSSNGTHRRVMDALNHLALCVGDRTVRRTLVSLSDVVVSRARELVLWGLGIFCVVYDNVNFTIRPRSQRLDSVTRQVNATTAAVFSLPSKFTRAAYGGFLSMTRVFRGREKMELHNLSPTPAQQAQLKEQLKLNVCTIILSQPFIISQEARKALKHKLLERRSESSIRLVGHEKSQFIPLKAMDQEEASVRGTIGVIEKIWLHMLAIPRTMLASTRWLMAGDWLSVRNIRLVERERMFEWEPYQKMNWIMAVSGPFHFQLNFVYALYRTHIGHAKDNDPASLHAHNVLFRRAKLDDKKPDYHKAWELLFHSLTARILDVTRIILDLQRVEDLKEWSPDWDTLDALAERVIIEYGTSQAAKRAEEADDECLQHSILFIRDTLTFYEYCQAIRTGDVGRMWLVYSFWTFMFRGAGCTNYSNELLEMKALYDFEIPPELRELLEHAWLVNRWGIAGRSIPIDLWLEHVNGFIKNMFAAKGSGASIEDIISRSSAPVEFLRSLSYAMTGWMDINDAHRRKTPVDARGDILALCSNLRTERVHLQSPKPRYVHAPPVKGQQKDTGRSSGVRDMLALGRDKLSREGGFARWKESTLTGRAPDALDEDAGEFYERDTAFDAPEGEINVEWGDENADGEGNLPGETVDGGLALDEEDGEYTQESNVDYMDVNE